MVDKPGITTPISLPRCERAVAETGRIWSVCLGRLASPAVQEALRIVRSGEIGRLVHTSALGAAPAEPRTAAGVVLRHAGLWRHHQRHRRALDRPVPRLRRRRSMPRSSRAASARSAPSREGFEDFAEIVLATPSVRGYVPARLVHAGRPADLGRRTVVRRRHRRHAGTAQEPRHRGPRRHRPHVRRQPHRHALHRLQQAAGDLLPRLPARHRRPHGDRHAAAARPSRSAAWRCRRRRRRPATRRSVHDRHCRSSASATRCSRMRAAWWISPTGCAWSGPRRAARRGCRTSRTATAFPPPPTSRAPSPIRRSMR